MTALIALVGRPNVGKSSLFNRIVGKRIAIVHDEPGVTRDRVIAAAEWRGRPFTLVDTGGLGLLRGEKAPNVIVKAALAQVELAIDAAHAVIFVVDAPEGIVPLDQEVAQRLRRSGKPVLVAVNKVDNARRESAVVDFIGLGFEKMFAVSAIHGHGVEALINAALALVPQDSSSEFPVSGLEEANAEELKSRNSNAENAPLKIAIVGRPNVGKSSIINALTESERLIVTPIPGTTRDAVDVPFEVATDGARQKYILIDTAGMRKPRQVGDSIEFFSVKRAEHSIERCDIVVLVLDAELGILEQDKKIADKIVAEQKACVVVVNKWDLVEDDVRRARAEETARRKRRARPRIEQNVLSTLAEFGAWVQEKLFFLDYAPVIFTSAKSGFHLDRVLEAVRYVAGQLQQKIPTALLNRTLQDSVERHQPVSATGQHLKFFYATQIQQAPPTFLLFVNRDQLLSEHYKKYLTRELRRAFGFEGCPLVLVARPRPKTVRPVRKSGPAIFRKARQR